MEAPTEGMVILVDLVLEALRAGLAPRPPTIWTEDALWAWLSDILLTGPIQ